MFICLMAGFIVSPFIKQGDVFAQDSDESSSQPPYWIYFGTSTADPTPEMKELNIPKSEGIYVGKFDPTDGAITDVRLAVPMQSSGFMEADYNRDILYVVGKGADANDPAGAYAYKMDRKTGDLTLINSVDGGGPGGCHIAINEDRTFLAIANYTDGSFVLFRINGDGSIGEQTAYIKKEGKGVEPRRQDKSYGHAVYFMKLNGKTRLFMVDLGLDRVYICQVNEETGELTPDPDIPELVCPPASGPRHLAWTFDTQGNPVVYVLNELDSTLSIFSLKFGDEKGKSFCKHLGTWTTIENKFREKLTDEVTLVDGVNYTYGNKTAEIVILKKSGKPIVYASNRGQDTLVVFDAEWFDNPYRRTKPHLDFVQRIPTKGLFPRYFTVDPTGNYMIIANKMSGTIYVDRIDPKTGILAPSTHDPIQIAWPIAMAFLPVE